MPGRRPPTGVLTALRDEVGFHCPVDVQGEICGSPYLTWHHFDPPWRDEGHHRPECMIALCREHADKADNGSFTNDQLRRLKAEGRGRGRAVRGRFDWMRRDLLAVVGGNAYLRTPVLLEVAGEKAIWFNRNDHGELLLNFVLPTLVQHPRASIRDNLWTIAPDGVCELICPPSGRKLLVRYANGDMFHAEFSSVSNLSDLRARLMGFLHLDRLHIEYPLTLVHLWERVADSALQLTPEGTSIGTNSISRGVMSDCGSGISIGALAPPRPSWQDDLIREARKHPHFRG